MTKPIFYEGQAVGCLMNGEGVVVKVDSVNVVACFNINHVYNLKGVCYNGGIYLHSRPTLYPIEQYREIIANLPAPEPEKFQPKPGEWCFFWNNVNSNAAVVAKFERMSHKNYIVNIRGSFIDYPNCAPFIGELPEHLKEVQP